MYVPMHTISVLFFTKAKTFLFLANVEQDKSNSHKSTNKFESFVKNNQKLIFFCQLDLLKHPSIKAKHKTIEYIKAKIAIM